MMQRDTIIPMLMMVAMFGMFIHYDLTSSTQYSVIDSIWPSIILILIIFIVVIIRAKPLSNENRKHRKTN